MGSFVFRLDLADFLPEGLIRTGPFWSLVPLHSDLALSAHTGRAEDVKGGAFLAHRLARRTFTLVTA